MKLKLYLRLALTGMRKNRQLYFPYLLSNIVMVMMFYIASFLYHNENLKTMRGGSFVNFATSLGRTVVTVFALIFLLYTNMFLVKHRMKELGLYNILGMNKKHIAGVLIWEGLMALLISLAGGLAAGVLMSKLAELCLVNLIRQKISYEIMLCVPAMGEAAAVFSIIELIVLLNTLRILLFSKPVELLRMEHTGERVPKGNWFVALLGVVILAIAYYSAMTVKNPLMAIMTFFQAVILVILATYLLFIAGSVTFCKLLQKNKRYYYKANHFVSVSTLVYRMKRNGAGLASICVLSTMVLVMVSATTSLYAGEEHTLKTRFPNDLYMTVETNESPKRLPDEMDALTAMARETTAKYAPENEVYYRAVGTAGLLKGEMIDFNFVKNIGDGKDVASVLATYDNLWNIVIISLEDYNRVMAANETLAEGEALIYTSAGSYDADRISIGSTIDYRIKKHINTFVSDAANSEGVFMTMYLVVSDFDTCGDRLLDAYDLGECSYAEYYYYYAVDLAADDETQISILNLWRENLKKISDREDTYIAEFSCDGVADSRADFNTMYGSLFFLGLLLGAVFLMATILIIYYKQISEGYEDAQRFIIMRKCGMTDRDIRKSINSQTLTVFFAPLLMAGMHLCFSLRYVQKLLSAFSMIDSKLFFIVTGVCFLAFALIYVLVYKITSGVYYNIVSRKN